MCVCGYCISPLLHLQPVNYAADNGDKQSAARTPPLRTDSGWTGLIRAGKRSSLSEAELDLLLLQIKLTSMKRRKERRRAGKGGRGSDGANEGRTASCSSRRPPLPVTLLDSSGYVTENRIHSPATNSDNRGKAPATSGGRSKERDQRWSPGRREAAAAAKRRMWKPTFGAQTPVE